MIQDVQPAAREGDADQSQMPRRIARRPQQADPEREQERAEVAGIVAIERGKVADVVKELLRGKDQRQADKKVIQRVQQDRGPDKEKAGGRCIHLYFLRTHSAHVIFPYFCSGQVR